MFKHNKVAVMIAAVLGASTAYAATVSGPTPAVVGFKPVYKNVTGAGAVTGKLELGETLQVDVTKLDYEDKDGDAHDVARVKYKWTIGTEVISDKATAIIPNDPKYTGQQIQLEVIPYSVSGDPDFGNALVLANLVTAGATGPGTGTIVDNKIAPFVDNLQLTGELKVGSNLIGRYDFNANGGNHVDQSVFEWGKVGETANEITTNNGQAVQISGEVADYTITAADAGTVLELSVQARNGAGIQGNMLTVDTTGKVTEVGGGGGGTGTGGTGGIVTPPGGGGGVIPFVKADPKTVTIGFNSSATMVDNGDAGTRPVANVDMLTAVIDAADGASKDVKDYTFKWFVGGTQVGAATAGANTFTPDETHQGKVVTVEVEPTPAVVAP